jgi:hypothetical protein
MDMAIKTVVVIVEWARTKGCDNDTNEINIQKPRRNEIFVFDTDRDGSNVLVGVREVRSALFFFTEVFMKTFVQISWALAGLAIAAFFSVATYSLVVFVQVAHEKVPQYEVLWSRGWNDFNSISGSIRELTSTTIPFVELFPELVRQVDEMNDTVRHMDMSVTHLSATVPPQMGEMSGQMGTMQRNMTPGGMMRQMMPW